ncbi:Putative transmembrane protein [Ceraceosorus bombacis]|uniref:Putative transmembrane protein n=1 Tax=Ceraceosorus bombacis TaxID=401625 RepID=A0A0P1BPV9_9BASI|nr:Putative transmembrane protein [Ceraceosorus bombacis]
MSASTSRAENISSGAAPRVTVTYSASYPLVNSDFLQNIISVLSSQLPLRNLHWKPTIPVQSGSNITLSVPGAGDATPVTSTTPLTGSSSSLPQSSSSGIRTIQSLPVDLDPLSTALQRVRNNPELRYAVSQSLLERPFSHLYFVACDDNEAYRNSIRNDIRSWISSLGHLPVHPADATPSANAPSSRPGTPRSSVHDSTKGSSNLEDDASSAAGPDYLIVLLSPDLGSAQAAALATAAGSLGRGASPAPGSEPEKKTGLGRVFGGSSAASRSNVIEKIRADFNSGKRERVVQLTRLPPQQPANTPSGGYHADPTLFADLLMRLKDSASATFDRLVSLQEEECRRELRHRDFPGWNICKWVSSVGCLANTFEAVGLHKEALSRYDEVDAAFEQCLATGATQHFRSMGAITSGDDSAPLLDTRKKPYYDLIRRSEISLFDFRCYIFARRAALLGKLGRVAQVMHETPGFVENVGRMLSAGELLPRHFVESWTFSSSIDVVEQCQAWLVERGDIAAPGMSDEVNLKYLGDEDSDARKSAMLARQRHIESQLSAAFHAAKAQLLDLARRQLDIIGMHVGHLPRALPFLASLPDYASTAAPKDRDLPALPDDAYAKDQRITRDELLQAIEDRQLFDDHLISLTERTAACWSNACMPKRVLSMQASLASLQYYREKYSEAYVAFGKLADAHAVERTPIEAHMLAKQLAAHAHLEMPRDKAWVNVVVALLKRLADERAKGASLPISSRSAVNVASGIAWDDERALFAELRTTPFEQELPVSHFSPLVVKVNATWASHIPGQDGSQLSVRVTSATGTQVEVDDIRVCLTSGEREMLWFTSGSRMLEKGHNHVKLSCPSSAPGKYIVDVCQVRIAKIIFQYTAPRTWPGVVIVGVPEDGEALDAKLVMPDTIRIDEQRHAILEINTGRNQVSRAELRLALSPVGRAAGMSANARVLVGVSEGHFIDESARAISRSETPKLEASEDGTVHVSSLSSRTTHRLRFPLYETSAATAGTLHVALSIDYWSAKSQRPQSRRQFRKEVALSVALPLGVNVQDYFRSDRLYSKFSITAGTNSNLRLGKVDLIHAVDEDDGKQKGQIGERKGSEQKHVIERPPSSAPVLLDSRQPASYVFSIKKNTATKGGSAHKGAPTKLRLMLRYRSIQEEAQRLLIRLLEQVLGTAADGPSLLSEGHKRSLELAMCRLVDLGLDVAVYSLTGQIRAGLFDADIWRKAAERWGIDSSSKEADFVVKVVESTLQKALECGPTDASSESAAALPWRLLSIPVDVPQVDIVNAVSIKVTDEGPYYVGQPIKATLTISTSFSWGVDAADAKASAETLQVDEFQDARSEAGSDLTVGIGGTQAPSRSPSPAPTSHGRAALAGKGQSQRLMYDVAADFDSWLASGAKRHAFEVSTSDVQGTGAAPAHEFELALIPLRHGSLLLPTVNVWALASKGALSDLKKSQSKGISATDQQDRQRHLGSDSESDMDIDPVEDELEEQRLIELGHIVVPSCATHQINAAEHVEVLAIDNISTAGRGALPL